MSERNNSNKKNTKGNLQCTDVPFSTSMKNQLHKISYSHCEFVGLSAGTVITKETKVPNNRVLPGALLFGCIVSFVVVICDSLPTEGIKLSLLKYIPKAIVQNKKKIWGHQLNYQKVPKISPCMKPPETHNAKYPPLNHPFEYKPLQKGL